MLQITIRIDALPAAVPERPAPPSGIEFQTPDRARRFVDNGDGTVTDLSTGLMWSKDDVTPKKVKHADAEKGCAALSLAGHSDWRLPTRAELLRLVDDTRHEPAIDVETFPSCKSDWYWSATPCAWSSDCAWIVGFGYGSASYDPRANDDGFVRAVRSVPAGQ